MKMYKGTIVVGAIHKHLHMCFLLEGHLTVANEDGVIEHKAPCYIKSTPGIKRVLYAHEDSLWYNTHKNPDNIEDIREFMLEELRLTGDHTKLCRSFEALTGRVVVNRLEEDECMKVVQ